MEKKRMNEWMKRISKTHRYWKSAGEKKRGEGEEEEEKEEEGEAYLWGWYDGR
jgi:hypothetical protein